MNEKEYFQDYEYVTNSQIKDFEFCPFLYLEKSRGAVKKYEKPYFTYGKAVDCILSGRELEEEFYIGAGKESSVIELEEKIEKKKDQISNHAKGGTMTMLNDLAKYEAQLEELQKNEGKTRLTPTEYEHILATAKEIKRQPLYKAFDSCENQVILKTEIDGIKVKAMLDKLSREDKIICDDKTTANMTTFDPEMYFQQLAWYRMLVREIYNIECHCYLSVGDKNATFKRSTLFFLSPGRLDYQEELNKELMMRLNEAKKNNDFKPRTEIDGEEARDRYCFRCDNYSECEFSKQKNFVII